MLNALGTLAGLLTTIAFVPQVWTTWKTRQVDGIDPKMYAIFTLGVSLWIVYGAAIASVPIVLFNAITLVLAAAQLVMLIAFRKHAKSAAAKSDRTVQPQRPHALAGSGQVSSAVPQLP